MRHILDTIFDILIVGAGPAGCAAALALKDSGLKVALVDKAHFPRHKTCGDAIPGPTLKALRSVLPQFDEELKNLELKQFISTCKIVPPKGAAITISWQAEAYNSPRENFDNFLVGLVKKYTSTQLIEGFEVNKLEYTNNLWNINDRKTGQTLQAKLLIGCDGANSVTVTHVTGRTIDRNRHCTAVAAYYKGVSVDVDTNVFFTFKKYLPGYFWVFPVGDNTYNVGFGIVSSEAAKHNMKLREVMDELIANEPKLQPMFASAKKISEVKGFGLPIGGKKIPISGEAYMLAGDAASLIDPLQGHGIDKAAHSGILAARQAMDCLAKNDVTASFIKNYDTAVYKKYHAELSRNYRIMKLLNAAPWLVNFLARFGNKTWVKKLAQKWF